MSLQTMQRQPLVSVVLPMRNAAQTIEDCLQSIARQSCRQFEVVVIDDGSTDESPAIVHRWNRQDHRIKAHRQAPLGLVAALNQGVQLAKGLYIARMDADDIMVENRLQVQLDFLTEHPQIDLVSSQVELFPRHAIKAGYQEYIRWQNNCLTHRDIADEIYVESPIAHPSVMLRRSVFASLGGYRQGDFPEDYELWLRMLAHGMQFAKVPQILLKWRESTNRTSRTDDRYGQDKFDNLRAYHLARDPRLNTARPLVVWGAGPKSRKRVQRMGLKPELWLDVDAKKVGRSYLGAAVVSYEQLRSMCTMPVKPFVLSMVTNHGARLLIEKELQACGFARGDDYLMMG